MGGSSGGNKSKSTITTPNYGTVTINNKQRKQLAMADVQNTANQAAIDKQTEANRVNQVNPWGEVNWTQSDPNDPNSWKQTVTLSPAEQKALESQQAIKQGLSNTAQGMLGGIGDTYSKPMDWSQFSKAGTPVTGAPGMNDYRTNGPIDPMALAGMGNVSGAGAGAGSTAVERAKEYELQKKLDLSGLSALPEADSAYAKKVSDSIYDQMASRLNPQWQEQERGQLDRLYAMGAREGDPAFEAQKAALQRQKTDAYNQANWTAIQGGGSEMERLFNMGSKNRQQTWAEALGQGQFTNEALNNQFQQGAFNAGQANQVGMANAANQTQASIASANNATNASIASANNRLQGVGMGLDYNMKGSNQWNDLVQQAYGNQRTEAADLTAERQRQVQEAMAARGQPLNELNALLSGQQVQNPNFQNFAQAGAAESGNYYGAYTDAQAQAAAAKAAQQQMITGLAGSAMGMFSFSDRRLKSNIVNVGFTPGGIPLYAYDIFGNREVGVMADEVPAEWTTRHPSGYLMVDYSRVR